MSRERDRKKGLVTTRSPRYGCLFAHSHSIPHSLPVYRLCEYFVFPTLASILFLAVAGLFGLRGESVCQSIRTKSGNDIS